MLSRPESPLAPLPSVFLLGKAWAGMTIELATLDDELVSVPDPGWWANELSLRPLGERQIRLLAYLLSLQQEGLDLLSVQARVFEDLLGQPLDERRLGGLWVRYLGYLHLARRERRSPADYARYLLTLYLATWLFQQGEVG